MAKLSYGARKGMAKSSFALPKEKTAANPAGKGGYPVPDIAHGRNALARAAQHASPAEQATIRRKVVAKFPSLGKGGGKGGGKPREGSAAEERAETPAQERAEQRAKRPWNAGRKPAR